MIQYHHPANRLARPSKVGSTMLLRKGVDIATSFTLTFENLGAVAYCKFCVSMGSGREGAN